MVSLLTKLKHKRIKLKIKQSCDTIRRSFVGRLFIWRKGMKYDYQKSLNRLNCEIVEDLNFNTGG